MAESTKNNPSSTFANRCDSGETASIESKNPGTSMSTAAFSGLPPQTSADAQIAKNRT
ncbi:hypothetical protein [Parasphingorhabdus sp.]